jgi:hypothetical protein
MARVSPREPIHVEAHVDSKLAAHAPAHTPTRTRRRKSTVAEDPFYINRDDIPEGLDYEWKRWSNAGEHDPFYIANMREQGWEPVDPKRHPTWVPPGYKEPHIIKGGQILMERPMELTLEARKELRDLAKVQVREAEQRLGMTPKDTLARDADPSIAPRVSKEYFRPVAIEE